MSEYSKVLFDGKPVTERQRQAFRHCDNILQRRWDIGLHCYQGSWQPATQYSGTTHTNAGVADLYVYGMSTMSNRRLDAITRILRGEGCQAAQLRGPFCNMPWHWHVCDLDTTKMDTNAIWQVGQYRAPGGPFDGLVAGRPSHNPWRPDPIRKWDYKH